MKTYWHFTALIHKETMGEEKPTRLGYASGVIISENQFFPMDSARLKALEVAKNYGNDFITPGRGNVSLHILNQSETASMSDTELVKKNQWTEI